MRIPFSRRLPTQTAAFDDDETRWNMMCGGWGAGKTKLCLFKMLKLSWLNRHIPGGLLAPSLPEFKRDFLPEFLDLTSKYVPSAQYWAQGKLGMHIKLPWSRAPIFIFSAERRIKGPNLGWGIINEFSLMPWVRIQEFIARRRLPNVPVPQIVFAGTPEDEYGWLDDFIEKNEKTGKLKVRYAATQENVYNDAGYAQDLLDNLDEEAANIYVYGRPGRMGSNFFFSSYRPAINDFKLEYDRELPVHAFMDFNVGRMCTSFWHVYGEGSEKQMGAFSELRLMGNDGTTDGMGRAIKARYGTDNVIITCDASGRARKTTGRSDIEVLESIGFKVRYRTTNPLIKRSQAQVNGLLAKQKIFINPEKCPLLKKDLLKVKQLGDFEMDKKNLELTHFGDGLRYGAREEFPDWLDRTDKNRLPSVIRLGAR